MRKKLLVGIVAGCVSVSSLGAIIDLPTTHVAQAAISQKAEIIYGVSFRTGPSTNDKRMRYLQKGETVTILGQASPNWYHVQDQKGVTGYVSTSSKYIRVIQSTSTGSNDSSSIGQATVIWGVSFRTGPSTSYKRTRYLQKGETITLLEKPNASWYKVKDQNGVVGYVSSSSKYLQLNGNSSAPTTPTNPTTPAPSPSTPSQGQNATVEKVISAGMKYLGTPYEYGSNRSSTKTFDCSDFVRRAFYDATGTVLPGDSRKQGDYVKKKGNTKTNWRQLQRGDLMFFMSYKGTSASSYSGINKSNQRITHVGIYLGDGKILHTYSKESGGVRTDTISGKHWEHRFLFGGSAL